MVLAFLQTPLDFHFPVGRQTPVGGARLSLTAFLRCTAAIGGARLSLTAFQSRNRDSCHFRVSPRFHRSYSNEPFQSRNRDSCHFRIGEVPTSWGGMYFQFQSRNRDSCHFRWLHDTDTYPRLHRFNLAIEILVISGRENGANQHGEKLFQSRNRDSCHFRSEVTARYHSAGVVSISQSRFLSFQVCASCLRLPQDFLVSISQSRFLSFQAEIRLTSTDFCGSVSISQSRFLSFQVCGVVRATSWGFWVSISQSRFLSFQAVAFTDVIAIIVFQSRNRDSCHFRLTLIMTERLSLMCFNLAIEILVISGT